MRFNIGILLLAAATFLVPAVLQAQQSAAGTSNPELDLAVTYGAQRSNLTPGSIFWLQGGTAELSATLYHGFGLAVDVAGAHASDISPTGVGLTMVTTTAGPRYTWSHRLGDNPQKRLNIFGQALIGWSHASDSLFPTAGGTKPSANSFALQIGGGVDVTLSRRFAIRALQADWLRTQFPNDTTGVQNNMRLGAGIVFRFP
jgi:opacity protein-like surface antigen